MRVEPIIIFTLPPSHIPTQGCYHNNMRLPAKIFILRNTAKKYMMSGTHACKICFCLENTAVITISVLLI